MSIVCALVEDFKNNIFKVQALPVVLFLKSKVYKLEKGGLDVDELDQGCAEFGETRTVFPQH